MENWNAELEAGLKEVLESAARPEGTMSFYMLDGFTRAMACAPEMNSPINWTRTVFSNKDPNFTETEARKYYPALMALFNIHVSQVIDDKWLPPFDCVYDPDPAKRRAITEWCSGFCIGYDANEEDWHGLSELYPFAPVDTDCKLEPLPDQIESVMYIVETCRAPETAVKEGTRIQDLPGIFDTLTESVKLMAKIGTALRIASDADADYDDFDDEILEFMPSPDSFVLEDFVKCASSKKLSDSLLPPYAILGLLTSIASAPEFIKPSEWMPLMFKDGGVEFKDSLLAETFIEHVMAWWNYCNEALTAEMGICLPKTLKYGEKRGPTKALKDFSSGYLAGYDWLHEVWDDFIEDGDSLDASLGAVSLISLQLFNWPNKLDDIEDAPDLVTVFEGRGNELIPFYQQLVSEVALAGRELYLESLEYETDFDDKLGGNPFPETTVQTVTNPNRHVGRNDPCPCGSGKKFKKCCLH